MKKTPLYELEATNNSSKVKVTKQFNTKKQMENWLQRNLADYSIDQIIKN